MSTVVHAAAQETPPPAAADPDVDDTLGELVRAHLEPSYLSFPVGLKGLDPLVFETSVVPNFSVLPRRWHAALFLTPKIVLRMFQGHSTPVKTPSYMPRLTAFFWFDHAVDTSPSLYFSAGIGHHSNGQSGDFHAPDGSHNHENGSFETNELDLATYAVWTDARFFSWSSVALEWHPTFVEDAVLRGSYGNVRIHLSTTVFRTSKPLLSELSARFTGIIGDIERPTNALPFFARFPVLIRYTVRPPAIDVGVYAAYYQGQDYYNIWYDRFISVLEFGISGNLSTGIDFDVARTAPKTPPANQ
ncbi:MAG TPA: hypothetical protein VH062_22440 [Polyangiaceae bacterium]|jgi:hypothetical protein|nr:hypothetical protein [Polyangiaceae bacterium]